jgi:transposase
MRKVYSTDLSDREWACPKPHPLDSMLPGTMRANSLREIFHALFYIVKNGCPRHLGTSLPLAKARGWSQRLFRFDRAK